MSTVSSAPGRERRVPAAWRRYLATAIVNAGALALVVLAFDAFAPQWSAMYGPREAKARLAWVLLTSALVTVWNARLRRNRELADRAGRP